MQHVIVIGGGIAGLSAAAALKGCRVTLLEAKGRFGGRIHSVRTSAGIVELGAEFLHGQSEPLRAAIEAAGLTTDAVSSRNQLFESERLTPIEVWETFSELTERIHPHEPDRSFRAFLDAQLLDDRTRRIMLGFAEGFNAADSDKLSTHALRRAEYSAEQMNGAEQKRLNQGYGSLIDFLVEEVRQQGTTLCTGAKVHSVRWRSSGVEVHALQGRTPTTFSGDAAIITLPLGVLKAREVRFDPPLVEKEEAVAGLEFGRVSKVTFAFDEYWWRDADFGFIHTLDEPIRTWWSNPAGPTIVGWSGGPAAEMLLHRSSVELEAVAFSILQRVFSIPATLIRARRLSVHSHGWTSDPDIRGAYSYIPINGLFLPRLLGAPVEETLFFAGEATARDGQLGTVFGAFESGQRAANELLDSRKTKDRLTRP